ncbi:MAG: TniQ family protein [Bacillus sp. (in: firmicutes)]
MYNIDPIGLGTPYVESLTSYITRLADAHCVLTGNLISGIYAPHLKKKYLTKISLRGGGFYDTAIGINGVGQLADEFSQLTNELTGRSDISCTTLLNWSDIFPTRGLLKKTKSWCPICYEEAKSNEEVIYDQLIWNFQLVDYCMKHKTPLVDTCESCRSTVSIINRTSSPGFCSKCGKWLGKISSSDTECTNNSLLGISLIGELLANDQVKITRSKLMESLTFYLNEVFEKSPFRAATYFNIPKSTFRTWISGKAQPNIHYLIQMCKMLGISIIEFLLNQKPTKDESSAELFRSAVQIKHNHLEIQNILRTVIENKEPVSISEVSRMIGCDRKLLSRMYKEECMHIKKKYNEHLQHNKNERLCTKTKQLNAAFKLLVKQNVYPSRRRLEEILGTGFLKEKAIQEYWNELKKEL